MTKMLEILPYVGVGAIRFGMRPIDVENLVGSPSSVNIGFLGEKTEYRQDNGLLATYSRETGGLVELGFSRNITDLEFDGQKIFLAPVRKIFLDLAQKDGSPYETLGFIVLLNLGITLTGFHDDNLSQKAVTVFEKGRWDDEIGNMKPFNVNSF